MVEVRHRRDEGELGNILVDGQGYRAVGGRRGNSSVELRRMLAVTGYKCRPLSTGIQNNINSWSYNHCPASDRLIDNTQISSTIYLNAFALTIVSSLLKTLGEQHTCGCAYVLCWACA